MACDRSTSHTLSIWKIYKAEKIIFQKLLTVSSWVVGSTKNSELIIPVCLYTCTDHCTAHWALNSNEWGSVATGDLLCSGGIHSPVIYYFCLEQEKKLDQGSSVSHTKEGAPHKGEGL